MMDPLIFVARLATAIGVGTMLGVERMWQHRAAGARTNALVSGASAAFILSSMLAGNDLTGPARIAGQIVTGIGFLGAGVIFKEGMNVRGLNTAATIWCSAAAGTLAGMGYLMHSAIFAGLVILTNITLRPLADRMALRDPRYVQYCLRVTCRSDEEAPMRALIVSTVGSSTAQLQAVHSEEIAGVHSVQIIADVRVAGRDDAMLERMVSRLSLEASVSAVSWTAESAHAPE
jgi:putative Mg2+ transporter-C (MgtC) family protein